MNVLSLCDGMSCGQIALKELGVKIDNYYAYEIEPSSIKVTLSNFPKTQERGNVMELVQDIKDNEIILKEDKMREFPKIDLVIFGSPCRSLSKATAGREQYNNGLEGVSGLFYHCNAILQWIKQNNNADVYFMVENVDSHKTDDLQVISTALGVEPILINSNLFSAQDRKRNYWTNIPIGELPTENNIVLGDILDKDIPDKYYYDKPFEFHGEDKKVCATLGINGHDILKRVYSKHFKSPTLTACRGGNVQKKVYDNGRCRKLTPQEYRKLQTIPEWYKMEVADSHIYNMCGDGWTVEVIKFIFKGIVK